MYLKHKKAIITGISRGIGKSIALSLLDRGVSVFGWGRTKPDYFKPGLHFVSCDITDENSVRNALEITCNILATATQNSRANDAPNLPATELRPSEGIDFLINNAGFGYFAPIESFSTQKFQEMMAVNVTGAFLVTKTVLPLIRSQGKGHIINISSIAGRVGMPQGEGYNASKFALAGFSESLFNELRKEGIKVTTVYPGAVQTHFFDEIQGVKPNDKMLNAADLAATIVHVLDSPPNYLIREIEIRPLNSK